MPDRRSTRRPVDKQERQIAAFRPRKLLEEQVSAWGLYRSAFGGRQSVESRSAARRWTPNRDDFIDALQTQTPSRFVEDQIFDRIPHAFAGDRSSFAIWKRELGKKLDVDPACLTLVGSAATGFSLNPTKNFKAFDEKSDLDVAVISQHHFSVGWRYLRMNSTRRLRVDAATRNAWDDHVSRYIYWGTLATDKLLGVLPFGPKWMSATAHMSSLSPSDGRPVNLRIYSDYDALRSYQIQSTKALRDNLIEANTNAQIP